MPSFSGPASGSLADDPRGDEASDNSGGDPDTSQPDRRNDNPIDSLDKLAFTLERTDLPEHEAKAAVKEYWRFAQAKISEAIRRRSSNADNGVVYCEELQEFSYDELDPSMPAVQAMGRQQITTVYRDVGAKLRKAKDNCARIHAHTTRESERVRAENEKFKQLLKALRDEKPTYKERRAFEAEITTLQDENRQVWNDARTFYDDNISLQNRLSDLRSYSIPQDCSHPQEQTSYKPPPMEKESEQAEALLLLCQALLATTDLQTLLTSNEQVMFNDLRLRLGCAQLDKVIAFSAGLSHACQRFLRDRYFRNLITNEADKRKLLQKLCCLLIPVGYPSSKPPDGHYTRGENVFHELETKLRPFWPLEYDETYLSGLVSRTWGGKGPGHLPAEAQATVMPIEDVRTYDGPDNPTNVVLVKDNYSKKASYLDYVLVKVEWKNIPMKEGQGTITEWSRAVLIEKARQHNMEKEAAQIKQMRISEDQMMLAKQKLDKGKAPMSTRQDSKLPAAVYNQSPYQATSSAPPPPGPRQSHYGPPVPKHAPAYQPGPPPKRQKQTHGVSSSNAVPLPPRAPRAMDAALHDPHDPRHDAWREPPPHPGMATSAASRPRAGSGAPKPSCR